MSLYVSRRNDSLLLNLKKHTFSLSSCWLWERVSIHYCHVDCESECLSSTVMLTVSVSAYPLLSCWLESECLSTTVMLTMRVSVYPLLSCWLWEWVSIHYRHVDFDSECLSTTVILTVRVSVYPLLSCWLWEWVSIHYCHVDFESQCLSILLPLDRNMFCNIKIKRSKFRIIWYFTDTLY